MKQVWVQVAPLSLVFGVQVLKSMLSIASEVVRAEAMLSVRLDGTQVSLPC